MSSQKPLDSNLSQHNNNETDNSQNVIANDINSNSSHDDPPKPKRTRKFDKRSRSGCLTCKKRRVKCDEFHPKCNNCARLRLDCNYGIKLLWEDEAIAKGISFGRSKQNKLIRQQHLKQNLEPNESKLLTLSEMILNNESVKWVKSSNDGNLFLNTTYKDFTKIFDMITKDDLQLKKYNDTNIIIKSEFDNNSINGTNQVNDRKIIISVNDNHINQLSINHTNNLIIHNPQLAVPTGYIQQQHTPMVKLEPEDEPSLLLSSEPFTPNQISMESTIPSSYSETSSVTPSIPNNFEIAFNFDEYFGRTFANNNINPFNPEFYQNNVKLEHEVFNYFIEGICPGCICYPRGIEGKSGLIPAPTVGVNSDLNPYLYLLVPLAQKSELLYKTLVAVASKQLSLLGNTKFEYLCRNYTSEILSTLPSLIKEKQLTKSNDWDEVLATVLMLCFTDISSSCGDSWLIHLNGAKEFLKDFSIRSNITPIAKFFIRYFISHEVMGETAWFQNKIVDDDDFLRDLKNDDDERIDLIIGASPHLISIINQISKLGDSYESYEIHQINDPEFIKLQNHVLEERDKLEVKLNNLHQFLKLSELDDHSQQSILKISEIKKFATLLYLHARIDLEYLYLNHSRKDANGNTIMEETSKLPKVYSKRMKKVKEITKKLMVMIESLPISMSLLWPLFVMGIVAVENEEQRWFVLRRLIDMERIRELASVKIARRVVESVWREKDLNCLNNRWRDMIKGKANTISLA